jgi:hypothetical protein
VPSNTVSGFAVSRPRFEFGWRWASSRRQKRTKTTTPRHEWEEDRIYLDANLTARTGLTATSGRK